MKIETPEPAFRDVRQYPETFLRITSEGVCFPVTYKKVWADGFGARGWKLDATIGDTQIIASTRETGQTINTSVFVHDILDHFLSGFGVSGHRSEAMALIQLSKRTGSDPGPDYMQMVDEDIMNGVVNGDTLISFLPQQLGRLLPVDETMSNKEGMHFLIQATSESEVRETLVEHFFTLGKAGERHANDSWKALGLNAEKRTEIGVALQNLLEEIDLKVEAMEIESLNGLIGIDQSQVTFSAQGRNDLAPNKISKNIMP